MAVAERTSIWPTIAEVKQAASQLSEAMDTVDQLISHRYRVLVENQCEPTDPDPIYAIKVGVPPAIYADVGLLSTFIDALRYEMGELQDWIGQLEAMRRGVSVKEAPTGGDDGN